MSKKRRSYEAGHSPKFMVVIDDSPECDRALYFASRRALRIGAMVLMLRVIETHDHGQQWLGATAQGSGFAVRRTPGRDGAPPWSSLRAFPMSGQMM